MYWRWRRAAGDRGALVEIGDEALGLIVLAAALDGIVVLPQVLESGQGGEYLKCLDRAALPRPVVHDRDPRAERVHKRFRARGV